jgi:lipoyl(octanoyl) transferase
MLFEEIIEIIDPEPHDAALNMAIDEALLRAASLPILRVYRWLRPALSFGYFGRFDSVAEAWPGREMVRRWTGGGVVPHGADITYTLIVPRGSPFLRHSARESYRMIHEEIAECLNGAGRAVGVAPEAGGKVSDACFENPVAFDLLADGMKIAGAAQRRTRCGLLHQGSIRDSGMNLCFSERLAGALAPVAARRELSPCEMERARALAAQKYATEAWLRKF